VKQILRGSRSSNEVWFFHNYDRQLKPRPLNEIWFFNKQTYKSRNRQMKHDCSSYPDFSSTTYFVTSLVIIFLIHLANNIKTTIQRITICWIVSYKWTIFWYKRRPSNLCVVLEPWRALNSYWYWLSKLKFHIISLNW
jgi:hypothetical protein